MQTYAVTVSHHHELLVVLLIGPVQSTSVAKRVAREWMSADSGLYLEITRAMRWWALDASAANECIYEAVVPHTINLNATHLR